MPLLLPSTGGQEGVLWGPLLAPSRAPERAEHCHSSRDVNMKFSEWGKWMEII